MKRSIYYASVLGCALFATSSTFAMSIYEFAASAPDQYFVIPENASTTTELLGEITFIIDSFDITQSVIADPISGSRMNSISAPENSMLGGHRDLYLEIVDGIAEGRLRANPFSLNSNLQIDMSAGVVGRASIVWDGVDGLTGMTPDHGLDVDFTGGGKFEGVAVRLAVDAAGAGQKLKLMIHSGEGKMSSAELEFPVIHNVEPKDIEYVRFADFVGDADLTSVSAFQMMLDGTAPSLDAQIDLVGLAGPSNVDFGTVPEPTSAMLLLIAIGSLAGLRRRK